MQEYKVNVMGIIKGLRKVNKDMKILLLTPTHARDDYRPDSFRFPYVQAIRDLCNYSSDISVVDLWDGEFAIRVPDLCEDGSHLGKSGNFKVAEGIKYAIRRDFPSLVPFNDDRFLNTSSSSFNNKDKLQPAFPRWHFLSGKTSDEWTKILNSSGP